MDRSSPPVSESETEGLPSELVPLFSESQDNMENYDTASTDAIYPDFERAPRHRLAGSRKGMKACAKWLCSLLLVILFIMIIAISALLWQKHQEKINPDPRPTFQLEDYLYQKYYPISYNLQWISGKEYIHNTPNGSIIKMNVESDTIDVILENITMAKHNPIFYELSADQKFALLKYNFKKQWRYSNTASYYIYDIINRTFMDASLLPEKIQYISWSPIGQKLVYVLGNNIYMKENPSGLSVQLTSNGEENKIFNGVTDWVYEEELFYSNYAVWWSPNATSIAYVEFNDTQVPLMEIPWYGQATNQYPTTISVSYPKAGAPNPTVKLFIVDTRLPVTEPHKEIVAPTLISSSDYYISTFTWVTDERLCVQWLRRIQNFSILAICDSEVMGASWNCQKTMEEQSTTGWVGGSSLSAPSFNPDHLTYYKILSNSDGYRHIHHFNIPQKEALTSGTWEAISIASVTQDFLYYISNEGFPGRRNLFKINLKDSLKTPVCISCDLRPEHCQSYSVSFSTTSEYYVLFCNGPGVPIQTLHRSSDGTELKILEDNKNLEIRLNNLQMPSVENKIVKLHGFDLWYQMILPPHFQRSKKYPLLIDVYGGPCSQKVDQRFRIGWAMYLASTENIIVASFDGRGSGYQGDKVRHAIYRRLGTVEVEDQILAVRQFISMGFIDETRVAIWGWSYGGYVTAMALGSNTTLFKCGISVAPVSDWKYYDSAYTERWMGLPTEEDNLHNYKNSTVMARAKIFKNVQYLLIHGTADDNVHFQQGAQISQALVDAGVDFDSMWYTDKDHSIAGTAHNHIYTHMSHFLKQCFELSPKRNIAFFG